MEFGLIVRVLVVMIVKPVVFQAYFGDDAASEFGYFPRFYSVRKGHDDHAS
jgi:hypothetical protein